MAVCAIWLATVGWLKAEAKLVQVPVLISGLGA